MRSHIHHLTFNNFKLLQLLTQDVHQCIFSATSSGRLLKLSFNWMRHTLSTNSHRPFISRLSLSLSVIYLEKSILCYPAAPCSPHRSPLRSSLNPAEHSRAGFHLRGSQSTPNTPKVGVCTPSRLTCQCQNTVGSLCFLSMLNV